METVKFIHITDTHLNTPRVGRHAAELVRDGEVLFLDEGFQLKSSTQKGF